MGVRPHDLIRLKSPDALQALDPPAWVAASIATAPWVVVRRGGGTNGRIAVGVRGANRSERFAAQLASDGAAEVLRPEALAERRPPRDHPAFAAMALLRPAIEAVAPAWGPAGAAGYELATGRPALTAASDLDLVLRMDRPPDADTLGRLADAMAKTPTRVDILLETPGGAVAFHEFRSPAPEVLLRALEGPRLVRRENLWAASC